MRKVIKSKFGFIALTMGIKSKFTPKIDHQNSHLTLAKPNKI